MTTKIAANQRPRPTPKKTTFATLLKDRNAIFTSTNIRHNIKHCMLNYDSSYIVCFSTGEVTLACEQYGVRTFIGGDMILVPRHTNISIIGVADTTHALLVNCTEFSKEYECKLQVEGYASFKAQINYTFEPTELKPALKICVDSIHRYKNNRIKCDRLYMLKLEEFATCLTQYYSKNELAYLFYPIIEHDMSFRRFVITSYNETITVQDLVDKSNMCRTVFYEKFLQEFGITAKQWMLKQKINLIERMLSNPGVRIKDIIQSLNFPSHEHFYSFCRRHFECKPSDLRSRLASMDDIGD